MNLGLFEKAEGCYRETLKYEEATADTFCHLGASLEKQDRLPEAIKEYRAAIKLDALWDEAWYGIGVCLSESGKWPEALPFLQKAVKLDDQNGEYYLALAETEYKMGNVLSSIEAFEKAAEVDADNPDVYLTWSLVPFDQGDFSRANDIVQMGISDLPAEADLYYRSVVYLIHAGQYRESLIQLEAALSLDYDAHVQLFEFFPELEKQKALYKIIQQYKKEE